MGRKRGRPRGGSPTSYRRIYEALSTDPKWFGQLQRETRLARNTLSRCLRFLTSRTLVSRKEVGRKTFYELIPDDDPPALPSRTLMWSRLTWRTRSRRERKKRHRFFVDLISLYYSPGGKELQMANPSLFRSRLIEAINRRASFFDVIKHSLGELDLEDYRNGMINAILWGPRGGAYWSRTAIETPEHDYQRPIRIPYITRSGRKRIRFVYEM